MSKLFARYKADMGSSVLSLTAEEQRELLRTRTEDGRLAVLMSMLPHVLAYVGRLSSGWDLNEDERMDLVQAGNLGALLSLETFDPAHEDAVYPWTWAKLYVKRQVIREGNLIHTGRASGGEFTFEDIDGEQGSQAEVDDRLTTRDEPEARMAAQQLHDALALLDDDDLTLINAIFWEGRSLREVGEELSISATSVGVRLKKAERKLFHLLG